jgi:3-phenylpropionate/cinnamic acid dioxygenase small subunit
MTLIDHPNRANFSHVLTLIVAILSLACFHTGTVSAAELSPALSLEQRLQRVEDEREIREMLNLYGIYLDSKKFAEYAALFAKEGTWSGGTTDFAPVKGPAEIQSTMEKAFAERIYDPEHITNVHLVTNIMIKVDGDRATGYAKYTVMTRNEKDESYARVLGHYDDTYIREDGRWKFLSRVANRDIP